jgi:hypothetical protein
MRGWRRQPRHLGNVRESQTAVLAGRHQAQDGQRTPDTLRASRWRSLRTRAFAGAQTTLRLRGHRLQPPITVLTVCITGRSVVTAPIVA